MLCRGGGGAAISLVRFGFVKLGRIQVKEDFSPRAVCCHQRPFASPPTRSSLPSDVPLEHVCSSLAHVTISSRQFQHLCLIERSFINLSNVNMPQWYEYVIGCALAKVFIFGDFVSVNVFTWGVDGANAGNIGRLVGCSYSSVSSKA
jgi:hypothetical protein